MPTSRPRLRAAATAVLAAAAAAAPAGAATGPSPDALPQQLPPAGARAASAGMPSTWLVTARRDPAAAALARRHGAVAVGDWGTYVVASARARRFAGALDAAGLLVTSEPNRESQIKGGIDPLTPQAEWRQLVVRADLSPPAISAATPLLALIDSQLDPAHPEFRGSNIVTTGTGPIADEHGTATAGVATAPINGVGFEGVWPNARTVNIPTTLTCADVVERISLALRFRASVLNMSYGSSSPCRPEYVALQAATARGVLLVAAAGNEFAQGNPLEFPASLPHVLTVAAADGRSKSAYFSNANAAVDLAAPGVRVLTTIPVSQDPDGDGFGLASGTSFAAPIVSGAAAWLRAARPELDAYQIQQVLRQTADDMGDRGFDFDTGWGFIDLAGALLRKAPRRDPAEPNDGITFVNGDAFAAPAKAIFNPRSRSVRLDAAIDVFEDPHDVYRVVVPGRGRVRVTLQPRFGDPDLKVFDRVARDVTSERGLVRRSDRSGTATERIEFVNRRSVARTFYVDVYNFERGRNLNSAYRLTVSRVRR